MNDDDLGLKRVISRRDFLDGVAVGVGGVLAASQALGAAPPAPYPPALTGLRGAHPGSFEVFHALRDTRAASSFGQPKAVDRHYDLVVVGAGISGLAAAYFYRRANPSARVLILDNHDDFGGHSRRNEFRAPRRTFLGAGGTQGIESPAPYSAVARALLDDLGIDVSQFTQAHHPETYDALKLRAGFFFDREHFGRDVLVTGFSELDDAFIAAAPLSETARADLRRLLTQKFDPWPNLSPVEKKRRLATLSYADFLTTVWKVDASLLPLFATRPHSLFGAGIDAVPAQDAFGLGFPGFDGLGLDRARGPGQNLDSIPNQSAAGFVFHFPDGGATLARLLVRRLIPAAMPGRAAEDIITAVANYAALDVETEPVRLRLNSTAILVEHLGRVGSPEGVRVNSLRRGAYESVTAKRVVLACWHAAIPYLCPELPDPQKEALAFAIKVPLVSTNVLIRRWTAFQRLGVHSVTSPFEWHEELTLDTPVSWGRYRHQTDPAGPIVVQLSKAACRPGLPIREQHRAGRRELYETSFETIERSLRAQLGRVLGPGGFDPAKDVLGITVNRWPHGYSYQYNSLSEGFWLEGGPLPYEAARRQYGNITIANADAGAYAYLDGAIDQAHRAVNELISGG